MNTWNCPRCDSEVKSSDENLLRQKKILHQHDKHEEVFDRE